jgi:archaellum component FlaC
LNIDDFLYYVQISFNGVKYGLHDIKDLINELDTEYDIDHFIYRLGNLINDYKYELAIYEIRCRALRDKLNDK